MPLALIRAACRSVANLALYPMHDVLGLGGSHRRNLPGTGSGNWGWRFDWDMVDAEFAPTLARIAAATGRGPFAPLAGRPAAGT